MRCKEFSFRNPGGACGLADILRTDGHRFRPLMAVFDDIKALHALVGVLERFIPATATLSSGIEQPIAPLPDGRIVMLFPRAGRINAA